MDTIGKNDFSTFLFLHFIKFFIIMFICSITYSDMSNYPQLHLASEGFTSWQEAFKYVCKFITTKVGVHVLEDEEKLKQTLQNLENECGVWVRWSIVEIK